MKKGSKFDDVIGGHMKDQKIEKLFFDNLEWMLGNLTQTAKKEIFNRFISDWNYCGTLYPLPRQIKFNMQWIMTKADSFGANIFGSCRGISLRHTRLSGHSL